MVLPVVGSRLREASEAAMFRSIDRAVRPPAGPGRKRGGAATRYSSTTSGRGSTPAQGRALRPAIPSEPMTASAALDPLADSGASQPTPVICTHTGWVVLRVAGADAAAFLHGQLSSDVEALRAGEGQYWSYNSPKGRMLANGALWREPPGTPDAGVVLLLAADLADPIRKRLSTFVLRAKVVIEDASQRHALIGLGGAGCADAARDAFGVAPEPATCIALGESATAFALPDRRIAIVASATKAPIVQAALARHASVVDTDAWRRLGVAAGVPWIGAATSDLFVPQAVNWDVLGGVSFRKGCYPGQEIVARMQYLGRIKERLFAFRTDALDAAAGARLYSAAFGPDQACGTVVNAAADPAGGIALLAVVQLAAVAAGDLALGNAAGPRVTQVPLPYELPAAAGEPGTPG